MRNKTATYIIASVVIIFTIAFRLFLQNSGHNEEIRKEKYKESFYGKVINYTINEKGSMDIDLDSGRSKYIHIIGGSEYEEYFYPWEDTYIRKFENTTTIELLRKDSMGKLYIHKTILY